MENSKKSYLQSIKHGSNPDFRYNREKERVECLCGHPAVWIRDGYVCGTITAYPCEYIKNGHR